MTVRPTCPGPAPARHVPVIGVVLAVVISVAAAGCGTDPAVVPADPSDAMPANAIVVDVVDGDTIEVVVTGRHQTVRLLGIDTPESVARDRPVECFGPEASDFTASLLPPDTRLHLVRDLEARDRYDRLLAYVYRADDGLFVNLTLAEHGYADALTIAPNRAHAGEIAAAVAAAKSRQLGLWGACGSPDVALGGTTGANRE